MSTFKYTPLDRSTRSIRLLSFVDDPPGPGIYCTLETCDLARCPPFVALSYASGNPKSRRDILVNHQSLSIHDNLYAALEVLQTEGARFSEDPSREITLIGQYFWVDCICINQEDIVERGHQVDLTAEILSDATCMVSWLGSTANDSDCALRAISEGISPSWDLDVLAEAFHHLLNRPYWRRVWTVPEFVLPENILILCGRRGAWYSRLAQSLKLIRGLLFPYRTRSSQVDLDLTILCDSREQWHSQGSRLSESFTLDNLVSHFFKASCTDARDRVYALLPLVHGSAPRPLLADYTINEERLYYRVLGHMRYSPSLALTDQWRRFRFMLGSALHIARHRSSFLIREALYHLSEVRRARRGDGGYDRASLDERQAALFLEDLADHLQLPVGSFQSHNQPDASRAIGGHHHHGRRPAAGVVDQARKAEEIVEHFRFFPRDEDPLAWRDFEDLVREALGMADRALVGTPFVEWKADVGRWGFEEEREQERRMVFDVHRRHAVPGAAIS